MDSISLGKDVLEEDNSDKTKFLEKFSSHLPLDLKPNSIYVPKIIEKPIKNIGKVAVIIPTKNKSDLVTNCIESFFEHCDPNTFSIFIADTGSDDDEKTRIKYLSEKYNNVSVIEYDYYNFAKINNDVVNNHVSGEHSHLLFCNNDVKLANNVVYNPNNQKDQNSWVELLEARYFDRVLTKTSNKNPNDKDLFELYKDPKKRLEAAEKIRQRIDDYDQDRWVY